MEPVKLTMKQVLVAARQAMQDNRLGKYSNHNLLGCQYRYPDGSCCVVGAAMSDEDAKRFGGRGIVGLVMSKRVQIPESEISDMGYLQGRHDNICDEFSASAFLKFFEDMEAKYGTR